MSSERTIASRTIGVAVAVSARIGGRPSSRTRCAEATVLGTEVVAPLGDAVRLVDRDQRDAARDERFARLGAAERLGRGHHQQRAARGDLRDRRASRVPRTVPSSRTQRMPFATRRRCWSWSSAISGDTTTTGFGSSIDGTW